MNANLHKYTITICLFTFILVFIANFQMDIGLEKFSLSVLLSHPQAFLGLIAAALGGSLGLPFIHILIASLFKSQRNSRSRSKILIGWSVVIIIVTMLALK